MKELTLSIASSDIIIHGSLCANHGQFADLVSSLASFYLIKSIFHHFYVNC